MSDPQIGNTPNRVGQLTVANAKTDKELASISPNGSPLIPPKAVPWLALLVGVAGVTASLPTMGLSLPPAVVAIATAIVALGTVLGIASPGARKKSAPEE